MRHGNVLIVPAGEGTRTSNDSEHSCIHNLASPYVLLKDKHTISHAMQSRFSSIGISQIIKPER